MSQAQNFTHFLNDFNNGLREMMNPENFTKYCNTNMDLGKMSDVIKKNTEAMQELGRVATENMQAMITRSNEMVQEMNEKAYKAMKNVASASNPEQAISLQQKFAQDAVCDAVARAKETFEMLSRSTEELLKISTNATEGFACSMPAAKPAKKAS